MRCAGGLNDTALVNEDDELWSVGATPRVDATPLSLSLSRLDLFALCGSVLCVPLKKTTETKKDKPFTARSMF